MGDIYFSAEESKLYKERNGVLEYNNPTGNTIHTNLVTIDLHSGEGKNLKDVDSWVLDEERLFKSNYSWMGKGVSIDYKSWGEYKKTVIKDFYTNIAPLLIEGYSASISTYLVNSKTLKGVKIFDRDELVKRMRHEIDLDVYPLGAKSGFSHTVFVNDIMDIGETVDFNSLLDTMYREYPYEEWNSTLPIELKKFDRHNIKGEYFIILVHQGSRGEMIETYYDDCLDFSKSVHLETVLRKEPEYEFQISDNTYMVAKTYMGS